MAKHCVGAERPNVPGGQLDEGVRRACVALFGTSHDLVRQLIVRCWLFQVRAVNPEAPALSNRVEVARPPIAWARFRTT